MMQTQENVALPSVITHDEQIVHDGFWKKLRRLIGKIPFAEDLVSAYFCALDPATPLFARATLISAVAYFVLPFDAIPDALAVIGFTDDAAVLAAAIAIAGSHITTSHRARARDALLIRTRH